jgi:hypothetical protein
VTLCRHGRMPILYSGAYTDTITVSFVRTVRNTRNRISIPLQACRRRFHGVVASIHVMSGLSTGDRLGSKRGVVPTLLTYYAPDDTLQGRRVSTAFNRFDMNSPRSSHMAAFQPRATDYLSSSAWVGGDRPGHYSTSWCTTPLLGALRDLQLKPGASIAILRPSAVADPAFYHGGRRKGCH